MLYREAGEFKSTYRADQAILTIRQDRWFMWALLVVAFLVIPLSPANIGWAPSCCPF